MEGFVERFELPIPSIAGDEDLWRDYGVRGQPAWVFLPVGGEAELSFGSIGPDGLADYAARAAAS